jgi:pentatricopeptide repeat protein
VQSVQIEAHNVSSVTETGNDTYFSFKAPWITPSMALLTATSLMVSAVAEALSLAWIELAMFVVAGSVYVFFSGSHSKFRFVPRSLWKSGNNKAALAKGVKCSVGDGAVDTTNLSSWKSLQTLGDKPPELVSVVESMQQAGRTASQIMADLRVALKESPSLLPSLEALPAAFLRDDAVDLLDGTLVLLSEHGIPPDAGVYAGLMASQLRRGDCAAVAATASRVPAEMLTPKMRAMLAMGAARRGRLDEALGHLRHIPTPSEGTRVVTPTATAQILALATKEQRIVAVTEELQRVHARLEPKHLEDIFTHEGRARGSLACRELFTAAVVLQVRRTAKMVQVFASALGQAGDKAGLNDLIKELQADATGGRTDIVVGESLAMALLDACKAVRDGSLLPQVLEMHRTMSEKDPGPRILVAFCSALYSCDCAKEACEYYEHEMLPKGVLPDAMLTNALVKAAASSGNMALAKRLSDHAATSKPTVSGGSSTNGSDLQRHAILIKAYGRDGNLSGASELVARLKNSGTPLTSLIHNCYLDACVQCGDMSAAERQFAEMKEAGLIDVVGYNTMLKSHLARGRPDEARALLQEMAARGLQANKVTFNELLHAKVVAKDRKGVWSLIDDMQKAGIRANSVTCSILLKSLTIHSPQRDVKRVMGLIEEIQESMDEVLLSSAIEACIRITQLDLLSELMRRHKEKGGLRNLAAPAYGSMIKAYGQKGDMARVHELWSDMEELGVKPTAITLGCMTEAMVMNGQADEALDLVRKQFDCKERRCCINTVIYSTLLKGFAASKRIDKVMAVYEEMRGKGISCNTITYNTLLDAFAKCCAMDRASRLLEDMKESFVEPDIITYSTIIKGYCGVGEVDRAFHVLAEMRNDGKFVPDEIMYNSILDGCAKQHRVEDALGLLDEMKASGICPSNYTLSILVKLLGHARRLNQAFHMVEQLSGQNGFRPNVQVYTCLVQACTLNRRLERALTLHDAVVADQGCRLDDKFYAVLARSCLQLHQPLKAAEVVRAAYQLQGHSLAMPTRSELVGMEVRALEEVAARLQAGGGKEQEALANLAADLLERHGIHVGKSVEHGRHTGVRRRKEGAGRGRIGLR